MFTLKVNPIPDLETVRWTGRPPYVKSVDNPFKYKYYLEIRIMIAWVAPVTNNFSFLFLKKNTVKFTKYIHKVPY